MPSTGPQVNSEPSLYAVTNVIDRVVSTTSVAGTGGLLAFDFDNGSEASNSLAGDVIYDTSGQVTSILGADVMSFSSLSTPPSSVP